MPKLFWDFRYNAAVQMRLRNKKIQKGKKMKLLLIRHGEPDYSIDSLTPKGWREAEYLSEKLVKMDLTDIYVSTMGRAKDTAAPTLQKLNREAVECEWLREFVKVQIHRPDAEKGKTQIAWDWMPGDWTKDARLFSKDHWQENEIMKEGNAKAEYDRVTGCFDKLLAEHGYVRDGAVYRAEKSNCDTLVFFCHFGVIGVLLSHLLNTSPMIIWQGACALPTSVTTLVTEERQQGTAIFRMLSFGDTSHLYVKGEEPSFAARFCECYGSKEERH